MLPFWQVLEDGLFEILTCNGCYITIDFNNKIIYLDNNIYIDDLYSVIKELMCTRKGMLYNTPLVYLPRTHLGANKYTRSYIKLASEWQINNYDLIMDKDNISFTI